MGMRITKSKFCAGVQCLKRLYLDVHQPELAAEPTAADQAIIEQGREVGMLARQMFPDGVEVRCNGGLDEAIRTTRELVANPDVSALFEAVFEHQNVLVKVDILHRRRDGRWRLIEVKSTTDAKDQHLEDVAIQYRVVSRYGLDVASVCLAHVNRGYVFDGQSIDAKRFFKIRNLTRRVVKLQPKLAFQLRSEFTILSKPEAPDIAPGRHSTSGMRSGIRFHKSPTTCELRLRLGGNRCATGFPSQPTELLHSCATSSISMLSWEVCSTTYIRTMGCSPRFWSTPVQERSCRLPGSLTWSSSSRTSSRSRILADGRRSSNRWSPYPWHATSILIMRLRILVSDRSAS